MARSMNQPGFFFFLGLTAIVAALSAVLAYAILLAAAATALALGALANHAQVQGEPSQQRR